MFSEPPTGDHLFNPSLYRILYPPHLRRTSSVRVILQLSFHFTRSSSMTKSDRNFNLEWDDTLSKLVLKRVRLPSMLQPLFDEINRDKKLLDMVCELVN